MKVAIATDNGYVSAHFGRCPSYTLLEIEEGKVIKREEIPNPGHSPGFLPHYLFERGVNVIIAGGMGPRAQALFAEKNIQTLTGVQGEIDEVIQKFIRQELDAGKDLCDHDKVSFPDHPCHQNHSPQERLEVGGGRICVTAKGKSLDSEIDPNFGRARYFLIVDPQTMEFEAFENPSVNIAHGAGIQSAQFVVERGVAAVLTGKVGPNAHRLLDSASVRVITVEGCTIREAIEWLKRR